MFIEVCGRRGESRLGRHNNRMGPRALFTKFQRSQVKTNRIHKFTVFPFKQHAVFIPPKKGNLYSRLGE
uniref:(California timema) hypothetical protein n=1 Tax=Timema californicum TaxID=61474 RepID=A0A7R9P6W4_TIMCA|nr:unnamed protein product [Timema californicum]